MMVKQWYNMTDASEYLGISKSRLYQLTSNRQIEFYQPGGKKIFFKEVDLEKWILSGHKELISITV